ncbi:hypothetical protein [Acinetobacter sp. PK01]|uniref:hypothetical protein n=1 Tax=Acinetobacter sp. PK01 TaxID=2930198 RepID=UPI001FB64071|nr:hypothetical protein [Acinetobacter sp. PK01]UOG18734.1 hypothetical protein MP622_03725 [Acinetobacter sp. PK01]
MWCIKKKGLYLSSQTVTYEDDYWEPSEIGAQITTRFEWVKDSDLAMTFMDSTIANGFLARQRGGFWRDAEVVEE